jgi:hypothetical protein
LLTSADYIYGVHNRMGEDLEDHLVLGLTIKLSASSIFYILNNFNKNNYL